MPIRSPSDTEYPYPERTESVSQGNTGDVQVMKRSGGNRHMQPEPEVDEFGFVRFDDRTRLPADITKVWDI